MKVSFLRRVGPAGLCLTLLLGSVACNRRQPGIDGFTFSPNGAYLAAAYSRPDSSFIYNIPIETGNAVRFTKVTEGFEGIPSFSPDGKRIVYSYSPSNEGRSHIVVANADGSDSYSWPRSEVDDFSPAFLPDNKGILFARSRYYGNYSPIAQPAQHEWDFYLADWKGTAVRQLTNENFYLVSRTSVSPDGESFLFVSSEQHGDVMEIYSLEDPPKPKLTLSPAVRGSSGDLVFGDAMFMPDGNSILFDAATTGKSGYFDYDIYRMDLKARSVEKLTAENGYAYGLQASRDGKTAVFMRDIRHWYGNKTQCCFLIWRHASLRRST